MARTFTSLIRCTNCGYNYRFIKERGVNKYLCSGYAKHRDNGGCTERNILTESYLLSIIQIFCNRNKLETEESNKFMKSIIERIDINGGHSVIIYYTNGEKATVIGNTAHI